MRFPSPLRSRDYGNPEDIVAARQAEAANKAKRAEIEEFAIKSVPVLRRPILTVRKDWSDARKAAEKLFTNFARRDAVSVGQSPALPASGSLPGEDPGRIYD